MKGNQELIMMVGLGVAIAYFAMKPKKAAAATQRPRPQQIAVGEEEAMGWQYFTDGTAIGPDGKYYYQGNLIYTP